MNEPNHSIGSRVYTNTTTNSSVGNRVYTGNENDSNSLPYLVLIRNLVYPNSLEALFWHINRNKCFKCVGVDY